MALMTLLPASAIATPGDNDARTNVWEQKKFDPEKYQKDLECFIAGQAQLTQQEAQNFFPVLREMQKKMRDLGRQQRALLKKETFTNEKAALDAIKKGDEIDIQIKKLQQHYHARFLKILPATKVLKCIHAEERFNRNLMRNIGAPAPKK